jgi:hypothetical protein
VVSCRSSEATRQCGQRYELDGYKKKPPRAFDSLTYSVGSRCDGTGPQRRQHISQANGRPVPEGTSVHEPIPLQPPVKPI